MTLKGKASTQLYSGAFSFTYEPAPLKISFTGLHKKICAGSDKIGPRAGFRVERKGIEPLTFRLPV